MNCTQAKQINLFDYIKKLGKWIQHQKQNYSKKEQIMKNEEFVNLAKNLELNITDKMMNQFEIYYNFLVEYNKNVNLTAITKKEEIYQY